MSDATCELFYAVENRRGNRNRRLRNLLVLPDPLRSSGQAAKFWHHDLANLDDLDLGIERRRTELRIIQDSHPSPWLRTRLQAIAAEQARRRQVAACRGEAERRRGGGSR